jgi:hypothetical protein
MLLARPTLLLVLPAVILQVAAVQEGPAASMLAYRLDTT